MGAVSVLRTRLALVALTALFIAMAWPVQGRGWAQDAHFALVRSIADGVPWIDRYRQETGDESYRDGHYFAAKAPGIALSTAPVYALVDATVGWPENRRRAFWPLTLLACVLPAVALVALVMRLAETFEPRSGVGTGVALGLGTMILPFATVLFSHAWSALLAFGCFSVLVHERRGPPRFALLAAAGTLAGVGVVFEYPTGLAGLILGGLAIARPDRLRRAAAYAGGLVAGLVPLLAFNVWAYGSPFTLSYVDVISSSGTSGHEATDAHAHGVFGVTWPSLRTLAELLATDRGALVLTPVLAAGVAGLVLLLRQRRFRAEAVTALAVTAAYLLYNAGVTTTFGGAFGGASPGPRYLVTALPFAMVALGVAYRRAPLTVLVLTFLSATVMVAATVGGPLVNQAQTSVWRVALAHGAFTKSVPWLLGWDRGGYLPMLPFFGAVAVAAIAGLVALARLRPPRAYELPVTLLALVAWVAVAQAGPNLVDGSPSLRDGALTLAVVCVAVGVAIGAAALANKTVMRAR